MNPDPYRGPFAGHPDVATKYANDVRDVIQYSTGGRVAGFIAEYIQGVGGSVQLPDGYLKQAYEHVRKAGGLCISDEVQTGFGRLGTHYWAFEQQGVLPDIVTMAKSIGNGFPLAAVIT
jgi:alanine-glyoxylate transaminase / (R)-3-amino-2-methylpropionate-pyruvate transaminase